MPREVVLISAVSSELHSARCTVANSLTALGYKPKWQDVSPTETPDQKAAIRKRVDRSLAVIQIVGHHHGSSPAEPDEEFGPVSYTQYEARYAHKEGKPVWYILLDDDYPTDCENDEPAELRKLQSEYRTQVETHHDFCHPSSTPGSTRQIVQNLRDDLSKIPRPSLKIPSLPTPSLPAPSLKLPSLNLSSLKRPSRPTTLFLCLLIIFGIAWLLQHQNKTERTIASTTTATTTATPTAAPTATPTEETVEKGPGKKEDKAAPDSKMEKILVGLADAENRSRIPGESLTLEELRTRAYALLETEFHLTPDTLASSLPAFAFDLYSSPESELIVKASAAYALNKFEEAEKLFLEQGSKDNTEEDADLLTQRILALEGAAQFATAQIQYARAVDHYRAAAALTSIERDPFEWARIHHMLAYALSYTAHYSEAEEILLQVLPIYGKYFGEEHPNTLGTANNLANAFNAQGKHSEAEKLHRDILSIRQRVLGADHPDTLTSRINLAAALSAQGKFEQAEEQHRTVLTIRQRILGADHLDTAFSRNNLAIALEDQGKHAEAEEQYRALLAIRERLLGAEHTDTLSARNYLAKNLRSQGKNAEAEEQSRAILAIRERLHGPNHYEVFLSCHNLALGLANQKKNTEALVFAKRGLAGFTKSLGADHPYTKAAQKLVSLIESHLPPSPDATKE